MVTRSPQLILVSKYLVVVPIWVLAMVFSHFTKGGLPGEVSEALFVLGSLAIAVVSFEWGSARGFPAKTSTGYSFTNILRCTAMTAIMCVPVACVAAPAMYFVGKALH